VRRVRRRARVRDRRVRRRVPTTGSNWHQQPLPVCAAPTKMKKTSKEKKLLTLVRSSLFALLQDSLSTSHARVVRRPSSPRARARARLRRRGSSVVPQQRNGQRSKACSKGKASPADADDAKPRNTTTLSSGFPLASARARLTQITLPSSHASPTRGQHPASDQCPILPSTDHSMEESSSLANDSTETAVCAACAGISGVLPLAWALMAAAIAGKLSVFFPAHAGRHGLVHSA